MWALFLLLMRGGLLHLYALVPHQIPCQPFCWESWPKVCRQGFIRNGLGAVVVTKDFCKSNVVEGRGNHKVKKLEPKMHAE